MHIGILGPLAVSGDDGAELSVPGSRLRRLLVRLAVDAGGAVPRGELVDAVWIDDPPNDATNALQSLVSRDRKSVV